MVPDLPVPASRRRQLLLSQGLRLLYSPIYILGVLTPILCFVAVNRMKNIRTVAADQYMRIWAIMILVNGIALLTYDASMDNFGNTLKYLSPPCCSFISATLSSQSATSFSFSRRFSTQLSIRTSRWPSNWSSVRSIRNTSRLVGAEAPVCGVLCRQRQLFYLLHQLGDHQRLLLPGSDLHQEQDESDDRQQTAHLVRGGADRYHPVATRDYLGALAVIIALLLYFNSKMSRGMAC